MKRAFILLAIVFALQSCATLTYTTYTTYADITQYESGTVIGHWPGAMLVQTLSSNETGQFIKVGGSLSFTTQEGKKMFISGGAIVAENIRVTRDVQEAPTAASNRIQSISVAEVKDKGGLTNLSEPVKNSAGVYSWICSNINTEVSVYRVSFGKSKTVIILKDPHDLFSKSAAICDGNGTYTPISIDHGMEAVTNGPLITTITLNEKISYPFSIINTTDSSKNLIDVKTTL